MKAGLWGIFGGVALSVGSFSVAMADPLEEASVRQVESQAPGARQVGTFLKGSEPKTDFNVVLEGNKCYWFSAVSSGKVEKIAVYLWAPGANMFTPRLTSERSESGHTTLAWCTKVAGMYKFQAKIEGSGQYTIGVFEKDAPKPVEAPAPQVKEEKVPDFGMLCDKKAAAAAPGAGRLGDFFEGKGNSYGHDDRFDFPIMLDAGRCYWVIACGEPEKIKSISLYLWGPNNKRITEAKSDNAFPMLGHCATETGMFKFQAKITGGSGNIKAGLYFR